MAPKLLVLFFFRRGSTGESFLLSRANRLCSIFLHWLEEPGVLRVSVILLSSTRSKMAMVCPPATNPAQKLIFLTIYFRWGKGSPLPFWGPSQSFGFSLPPSWSADFLGLLDPTQVRLLGTNICWSSSRPLWPTFILNGHFFDG